MKESITGIVLAGGKSKRMGADKAFLKYQQQPLLSYAIKTLEPLTQEILIVANNKKYEVFGKNCVPDLLPNMGPVGGIYTGLSTSKTELNLVLGCDTPLVNQSLLSLLLKHAAEPYQVVQVATLEKRMPLIALYKKNCVPILKNCLERGEFRLQKVVSQLHTKTLLLAPPMARLTLNINCPEDMERLEKNS